MTAQIIEFPKLARWKNKRSRRIYKTKILPLPCLLPEARYLEAMDSLGYKWHHSSLIWMNQKWSVEYRITLDIDGIWTSTLVNTGNFTKSMVHRSTIFARVIMETTRHAFSLKYPNII